MTPGVTKPRPHSYWIRTAIHALIGSGIGVGLGIVAGLVFALIKIPEMGLSHSETVPAVVSIPLVLIGIASEGAILGWVAGLVVGYLLPVRGGSPFLTGQLPLKFILLSLVSGTVYLGIVRPKLGRQHREQDLQLALGKQDAREVRRLVEQGARVDTPIGDGTPLFFAAQEGNVEICRYLLSKGADINGKNMQGETALIVALKRAHPEVAQALVDSGADVNLTDTQGQTPLMLAAALNNTSIVEALISKGAEINHVVQNGSYSPLITAVMYRRAQNVELLLRSGANPNLAPPGGDSPLTQARRTGDQAIVDLLTAQGAQ